MKHLLILFALAFMATLPPAAAQDLVLVEPNEKVLPDPDDYPWSFQLYVGTYPTVGYVTGYRNMEALLQRVNIETDGSTDATTLGFGGRWRRIYLDVWGNFPLFARTDFSDGRSSPGGVALRSINYAGAINLGLAIFQDRNNSIILHSGIGLINREMQLREVATSSGFNFNNLSTPPSTMARAWPEFTHYQETLDIGVGWQLDRPKSRNHFTVGVRVGCQWGLGRRAWQADGRAALNAPKDTGRMFYLMTTIGISRNWKSKKGR